MRSIRNIHKAEKRPTGYLSTVSPLPTERLAQIDPFIFLNHHGPQHFGENNPGLPFGPHPHRGIETVTFVVDGDIVHEDTGGHRSVIETGGIQWMTAGSGLLHSETSSDEFIKRGGNLEILQLWINLPSSKKMTRPDYQGLQQNDIPEISLDNQGSTLNLIAGAWEGVTGAHNALTDVFMSTLRLVPGAVFSAEVPTSRNIFLYLINGLARVNNREITSTELVEFDQDAEGLEIQATSDSLFIFGHASPYNEPVVAEGPFVMNTRQEILQAYHDYHAGKMGVWRK